MQKSPFFTYPTSSTTFSYNPLANLEKPFFSSLVERFRLRIFSGVICSCAIARTPRAINSHVWTCLSFGHLKKKSSFTPWVSMFLVVAQLSCCPGRAQLCLCSLCSVCVCVVHVLEQHGRQRYCCNNTKIHKKFKTNEPVRTYSTIPLATGPYPMGFHIIIKTTWSIKRTLIRLKHLKMTGNPVTRR